ncbi:unnamed protein product [Auanema sp. JU1783]|nr:unnamed protein product [Auanema sp. JU1783]
MTSSFDCLKEAIGSVKEIEKHRKECEVCGDQANGYNFGVLTCESCKAFFRRTVSKKKPILCPFSNSCGITAASRRFCQACRLKKCFSVGMRLNLKNVTPTIQKKLPKKNKSIEKNTKTHCECVCQCGFFPKDTLLASTKYKNVPNKCEEESTMLQLGFSNCEAEPVQYQSRSVWGPADEVSQIEAKQNEWPVLSHAVENPISTILKVYDPVSAEKYNCLIPTEKTLLRELILAAAPLNNPLDMQFENDQLSLLDIVRITETALRRIVCMAVELQFFRSLPLEDKKILIKGSCTELLILRGVMAYDSNRKIWSHSFTQNIRGMEIKLDVLQRTVESQHFEEHKRFLESFDARVRKTENVILVLMAIVIFQSDNPKLGDQKRVDEAQKGYLILLKKVLECEFGQANWESMFSQLLTNLQSLRELNQGLVKIYCGFDSSQLDPLLKELFDM